MRLLSDVLPQALPVKNEKPADGFLSQFEAAAPAKRRKLLVEYLPGGM